MKQVLLVAKREYAVRMRSKVAVISLLVIALLMLGAGTAARIFIPNGFEKDVIGLTPQTQGYAIAFGSDSAGAGFTPGMTMFRNDQYRTEIYPSDKELEQAVQDDEAVAGIGGTIDAPVLISKGEFPLMVRMMVQATHATVKLGQYVTSLGGDLQDFGKQLMEAKIETKNLAAKPGESGGGFNPAAYFGGMAVLGILFITVIMSGQMVSSGVLEEKASRVIEVLVSAVSPTRLLVGKILGITAVGITQLVILGGSAVTAMFISGFSGGLQIDLRALSGWMVVWFVLGLATYMVLYAGAGAMAAKPEDLGQTMLPLTMLQIASFYAAIFNLLPGKKEILDVVSLLPFFNCYMMPARQVASATVQWWEPWVSVGINLAVLPLLIWLGAAIYRRGILATGSRLRLKEVFGKGEGHRATRRKNG